jgi:hypothetical protein
MSATITGMASDKTKPQGYAEDAMPNTGSSRRDFMRGVGLALSALALAPGQLSAEMVGEGRKPNSVIILSDDLGYGDTTCYGGMNVNTPHIDGLAKRDNLIPDRYSQCVWASRLF